MNTTPRPNMKHRRRPVVPALPPRTGPLLIAVLLSVGLHLLTLLTLLLLPRSGRLDESRPDQATIELLRVEQKGSEAEAAGQPQESASNTPPAAAPPKANPAPHHAPPSPQPEPLPTSNQPDEPAVPPSEPAPSTAATVPQQPANAPAETPATPPAGQKAPVFNLSGTDSESNAVALGGHILPAKPDDRFRNRPPVYPVEAERRKQRGTVVVIIHVSPNGLASGVDVLESSGVLVLDQAAIVAVRKWRFHPAMDNGRTVSFDMPFRFVFDDR